MLSLVHDTNVLVSGSLFKGTSNALLTYPINQKYQLILSDFILRELISVLRDKEKFNVSEDRISDIVTRLREQSKIIEPTTEFDIIQADKSDNAILSTAYDGKADYIVSRDKHVMKVKEFEGIKIVTPDEMLGILPI